MQDNKEGLQRFMRKRGAYIAGVMLVAAIVALMVIGKTQSVNIQGRYLMDGVGAKQKAEDSNGADQTESFSYDQFFGADRLGLGYEAHFEGFDGEMFIYKVELNKDIDDSTLSTFDEQLEKKCGKLTEDNFYGDVTVNKKGPRELQIILDLGNADSDKAILGILKALNEVEGVVKATVNGDDTLDYRHDLKTRSPVAEAITDEEKHAAAEKYGEEIQKYFDGLGLPFEVKCAAAGTAFMMSINFNEKPDEAALNELKQKISEYLDKNELIYQYLDHADSDLTISATANDGYKYLYPGETQIIDGLLQLLDKEAKGIKLVTIY